MNSLAPARGLIYSNSGSLGWVSAGSTEHSWWKLKNAPKNIKNESTLADFLEKEGWLCDLTARWTPWVKKESITWIVRARKKTHSDDIAFNYNAPIGATGKKLK